MSKLVSPARLRAIYALLITFPPFNRWDLPVPAAVRFSCTTAVDPWAEYDPNGKHHIKFSSTRAWSLPSLISTMAHEMVHLRQNMLGKLPANDCKHHNAYFHRLALRVCEHLGFNREDF